jgi:hypothetical protein
MSSKGPPDSGAPARDTPLAHRGDVLSSGKCGCSATTARIHFARSSNGECLRSSRGRPPSRNML